MKMNRIAGMALAGICLLGAGNAYADESVAVMKIDALGSGVEEAADVLLSALRDEITNSDYILDAAGNDVTYSEMQMITGCDDDGNIACYNAACEALNAKSIIFGTIQENGDTHLIWFKSGRGIFREVNGSAGDRESVIRMAKEMIVGDMGSVIVTSNIPGADVFIDGKRVGMSYEFAENAKPIELVTGNYVVSIRKDGYAIEGDRKVVVTKGNVSEVHINMTVAKDPEQIRRIVTYTGYGTLGAGAVAMIVSGAILGVLKKGNNDFNEAIRKGNNSYDGSSMLSGDFSEINKQGRSKMIGADVGLGIGGFLLAAGVALVVTGFVYDFEGEDVDKAYSNKYMPKVDFNLSPEYQGMTMGWSF
ncbi:MAG: PEGA domain-containing protein [Proteobacteria bacterium]|nr:PEGA domain-containing protein [Pseudomonadota bacterium]